MMVKFMININKYLKEKFNYNYTGDKQDFYNQDFIEFEGNGKDALFWLIDGNDRYLFKKIDDYEFNIWGELLAMEFAKEVGFDCANYEFAKFEDMFGFVTKSFVNNNESLINFTEVMQRSINDKCSKKIMDKVTDIESNPKNINNRDIKVKSGLNNYLDICEIINSSDKLSREEKITIKKNLINLLCFDLITMQGDRHPDNFGLIKNNSNYKFSPIFDNSSSFGLGYPYMEWRCSEYRSDFFNSKYYTVDELKKYYNFKLDFSYNNNKHVIDCLDSIFADDNLEILSTLAKMCDILSVDFLENTIANLEKKLNFKMNDNLRFYIINMYEHNLNYIKMKLNEKDMRNNYGESKNNRKL